ncbi:MAG: glycosyltransferase family 2 protein [Verrucomicrobia bacterium]|jgi:glycosyltransferase involved in cell wall biosynthesis|nr:glycosyltransferase family 2 protein [Verrucomicrobiota bacterium]
MVDVSVVAPVYNEEENVPLLCEALHNALSPLGRTYEVILVDDGSSDTTWEQLCKGADTYPHIQLIRFRRNFGQTAAMSAGFEASIGEVVITMDADLQNDPNDIPMLLELSDKGIDVVSGWRKDRKDTFINRKLPSMIANALISKITGVYLHDYGCTLKAYKREVVDGLHLYGEMHRFIPAVASWVGATLDEVPVNHRARQFGTTKYGISRTFRVILDLMTVKFLLRYSTHPIQMFGKVGAFFGIPGLLILGTLVAGNIAYFFGGGPIAAEIVSMSKRPMWVIAPFMLVLFFMQFISMGLLAEIQIRTYHESQDKPTYVIKEKYTSPTVA